MTKLKNWVMMLSKILVTVTIVDHSENDSYNHKSYSSLLFLILYPVYMFLKILVVGVWSINSPTSLINPSFGNQDPLYTLWMVKRLYATFLICHSSWKLESYIQSKCQQ